MNKMKFETPDLMAENVEKIAALFPSCVTEMLDEEHSTPEKKVYKHAINFEQLKQMLSPNVVDGEECYEFTWVGKKAAMVEANKPIRKTLRPVLEDETIPTGIGSEGKPYCSSGSKNWDTTENLYIEGDNLEVLKLLQESYLGKVKMIYIDPPYNTGHDFVYPDSYIMDNDEYNTGTKYFDEDGNVNYKRENSDSAGKYHSDWCSMIYSRLLLARNLLTDDGVIFISIDDNEQENLKKICDEVFGASNYRNQLLVRRRIKSLNVQFANDGLNSLNVGYEYIYVYAKSNKFLFAPIRQKKTEISTEGHWNTFWSTADRPTMRYEVLGFVPETGQWRWQKELANEAVKNYQKYEREFSSKMSLEDYWISTGKKLKFISRNPNSSSKGGGVQYWLPPSDSVLRTSNWTDIEVSQIIKNFGLQFDNPKSTNLMKEVMRSVPENDFIVMDFFSGSATTAHAVMQLNAEDGGHRKFIMVQLPEPCDEKSEAYKAGYKNICEIGKERIRRAGEKIKSEIDLTKNNDLEKMIESQQSEDKETMVAFGSTSSRGVLEKKDYTYKDTESGEMRYEDYSKKEAQNLYRFNPDALDVGFRVLKLDDSNMKDVYYAPEDYDQGMLAGLESNIKDDRTDLDLLFGCLIEWGLPLSLPYKSEKIDGCTVHTYNDGDLIACFDANIPESVVKEIAKRRPLRAVFRDSGFASSPEKINVLEIFKAYMSEDSNDIKDRVKVI